MFLGLVVLEGKLFTDKPADMKMLKVILVHSGPTGSLCQVNCSAFEQLCTTGGIVLVRCKF